MGQKRKLSVRVNEREYAHLKKQTEIAGLKMEPFIRNLIMNIELKPRPPEVYAKLLRELSAIGNNINQIAYIANANKNISNAKVIEACDLIKTAWRYVKELG